MKYLDVKDLKVIFGGLKEGECVIDELEGIVREMNLIR